jgi:magnesium-transporting ATPase (P-type)
MGAVQASDYAIGEFKMLRKLLLYHGRANYYRIVECILYFFYKNFMFTMTHFLFVFVNLASAQTIIDDSLIALFNLIFTSLPLGVKAIVDYDIRPDDGKLIDQLLPYAYFQTQEEKLFNMISFTLSLIRGTFHSLINFVFVLFIFWTPSEDDIGNMADLWFLSAVIYTNIIFVNLTFT